MSNLACSTNVLMHLATTHGLKIYLTDEDQRQLSNTNTVNKQSAVNLSFSDTQIHKNPKTRRMKAWKSGWIFFVVVVDPVHWVSQCAVLHLYSHWQSSQRAAVMRYFFSPIKCQPLRLSAPKTIRCWEAPTRVDKLRAPVSHFTTAEAATCHRLRAET